jgi:ribosome maturation factor RimP
MVHPVIPQVIELATPVADELGLEVVGAVFQTNHSPPTLRLDIRNRSQADTSLQDCEQMSIALGEKLDATQLIADAYVLEVSSPGVSDLLSSDRDFIVFKGFTVEVQLCEPHKGKQTWLGKLVERNETQLLLNQKGRPVVLPRNLIQAVKLSNQLDE